MRLKPYPSLATLSVALVLLLAAAADARIIVGHGLSTFKLGDTRAEVRNALGKPQNVQHYQGGSSEFFRYYWITLNTKGRVRGIEIADPKQRTRSGLGPGVLAARFKAIYPKAKCRKSYLPTSRARVCNVRLGRVNTNFVMTKKISLIDIGTVGEN